jgi:hypothetical protein
VRCRTEQKASDHRVGGTELRVVLEIAAQPARLAFDLHAVARDQPYLGRQAVHWHHQQIVHPIVRDAAPRYAADVARNDERSPQGRWREKPIGSQATDRRATPGAILLRHTPGVVGFHGGGRERAWCRGKGLRRRSELTCHIAFRNSALFDGYQRQAGLAIEDEEMTSLRGHAQRCDGPAILVPAEEDWRRRDIVVPEVVVDRLKMPDAYPGIRPQCHDRVGEQVIAQSLTAKVVVARAAGRDDHEVPRRVGNDQRPGVGTARACRAVVLP